MSGANSDDVRDNMLIYGTEGLGPGPVSGTAFKANLYVAVQDQKSASNTMSAANSDKKSAGNTLSATNSADVSDNTMSAANSADVSDNMLMYDTEGMGQGPMSGTAFRANLYFEEDLAEHLHIYICTDSDMPATGYEYESPDDEYDFYNRHKNRPLPAVRSRQDWTLVKAVLPRSRYDVRASSLDSDKVMDRKKMALELNPHNRRAKRKTAIAGSGWGRWGRWVPCK